MNRLKELRLEKNKLQPDIGRVIGVSGRAIGNYEREQRKMSPEIILKLCKYFNVSADYFLGKTNIRNSFYTFDEHFTININDDSMSPVFIKGDIVIVQKQENVENNEIAVVSIANNELIRKVNITELGMKLIPLNPIYEPVFYTNKEIEEIPVKIKGIVKKIERNF